MSFCHSKAHTCNCSALQSRCCVNRRLLYHICLMSLPWSSLMQGRESQQWAQSLERLLGMMAFTSCNHSRKPLERELKPHYTHLYLFEGSLDIMWILKEISLGVLRPESRQLFWFRITKVLPVIPSSSQVKFKLQIVMFYWRFFPTGNPIPNLFIWTIYI